MICVKIICEAFTSVTSGFHNDSKLQILVAGSLLRSDHLLCYLCPPSDSSPLRPEALLSKAAALHKYIIHVHRKTSLITVFKQQGGLVGKMVHLTALECSFVAPNLDNLPFQMCLCQQNN